MKRLPTNRIFAFHGAGTRPQHRTDLDLGVDEELLDAAAVALVQPGVVQPDPERQRQLQVRVPNPRNHVLHLRNRENSGKFKRLICAPGHFHTNHYRWLCLL